jgi:hypothetical protein
MKVQRVYIDTSVIGGCFDTEFETWSNGLFEDFRLARFLPVISAVVAAEVEDAPAYVRAAFAELEALGAEVLLVTDEALDLADAYLNRGVLTPKYYDDATHIALATLAEVDLLVSWNFRHIVHYDKIRAFNAVNIERGYKPIQIYSPREVTHHGEAESD